MPPRELSPVEVDAIRSTSPVERSRAIESLISSPRSIDSAGVVKALQVETTPQNRRLLLRLLALKEAGSEGEGSAPPDGGAQPSATASRHDVASVIRHELSPVIGWLRLAASQEIEDFDGSRTSASLRQLQRRLDGLITLISMDDPLAITQHRLYDLLNESWAGHLPPLRYENEALCKEIQVETDTRLFGILISNALDNAAYASLQAVRGVNVQVQTSATEGTFWVRITNPFAGERFDLSDLRQKGTTTKAAHQGQGIAYMLDAARRLSLDVDLRGRSGTASMTISGPRWRTS